MKDYHYLFKSLERITDCILNFFAIYLSYYGISLIYRPEFRLPEGEMLFYGMVGALATVFLYSYHNVYQPMRTRRIWFFLARIFAVDLEVTVFFCAVVALLPSENTNLVLLWIVLSALLSMLIIMAKKISLMTILHNLRSNRKNIKHILVVTDSQEMVDNYMEEIRKNPQFGYSVIGYIGNLNVVGLPHLGTTADLDHILKEFRPDEVVMAFDTVRKKVITKYIDICNDNCCKVMFVPAICGYFKAPRQVTVVGNLPLIDIRSNPLDTLSNRVVKRLTDIVISSLLIVLTSPLMLFTAIGVRVSSPGPILFCQKRVGRNNREFVMYKFRSMTVNNTQETGWSNENDSRKTRFGAFIRKFALDELPQFINVLKGDMSLVGPRPEVPFYVEKFKKEVPLYMLKHTLRPGITGLAQIKGLRGDTSIQARIEEDINYIENWTFWGDIRILLLTPFHAINRHEKYVEKEEAYAKREAEMRSRIYIKGSMIAPDPDPLPPTESGKQPEEGDEGTGHA